MEVVQFPSPCPPSYLFEFPRVPRLLQQEELLFVDLSKSSSPSFLVQLPSFLRNRTGSLQSSIEHWSSVFQLLTDPDRSTHRGSRDLSDPFVKDRHTFCQAFPDIVRHLRAHRKPSSISCHMIPPAFARNLLGLPAVFNERPLLQMYPLGIQHAPKETSKYKRVCCFFF